METNRVVARCPACQALLQDGSASSIDHCEDCKTVNRVESKLAGEVLPFELKTTSWGSVHYNKALLATRVIE